jgi:tetratricopeptide (TPR) repeat protein
LPAYYFNLSGLYSLTGEEILAAETLKQGRIQFPGYKDLVFKQLNYYADKQDYKNVIELLPIAFKLDEYSIPLNYLAGFSYDVTGNISKAEEYYRKVLNSDPNDYDSNYSLGLLYLSSYVKDQDKKQNMYTALSYLSKANEIDPYQLNTLQSLATLYRYSGDEIRLQRVNSKINQLKLN